MVCRFIHTTTRQTFKMITMKHNAIACAATLMLAMVLACGEAELANPPSAETIALRNKYNDKVAGTWHFKRKADTDSAFNLYEEYRLEPGGRMTGIVRQGHADSVLVTWQEGKTGIHGTTLSPKKTHNYRYWINDTISGRWWLEAQETSRWGNVLVLYVDHSTSATNRRDPYHAALSMDYTDERKFVHCDGLKLVMHDVDRHEATFSRGKGTPSF